MGAISATLNILNSSSFSVSRLTAAYLAQEGVEIIRNIRDTNWLETRNLGSEDNSWKEGLTNCAWSAACIVDWTSARQIDPNLATFNDQYLNIDSQGFYSYDNGASTRFQRKIIIEQGDGDSDPNESEDNDVLRVTVEIIWRERGKNYNYILKENLYN